MSHDQENELLRSRLARLGPSDVGKWLRGSARPRVSAPSAAPRGSHQRGGDSDGWAERLRSRARALRDLHSPPECVVLPGTWDPQSARALAGSGAEALCASESLIAAACGYDSPEPLPRTQLVTALDRIAAVVDVPVAAELRATWPSDAFDLVDSLVSAGIVGCTVGDSAASGGGAVAVVDQAGWIQQLREAAWALDVTPFVLTAGIDEVPGTEPGQARLEAIVRRARAYVAAGADCISLRTVENEVDLAVLLRAVPAPLEVPSAAAGLTTRRLCQLGVARVRATELGFSAARERAAAMARQLAAGNEPFNAA